ncbi:hypothetical protein R3P38DRAFT_2619789 [Favolaschia claudopus]|uniref:NAD(P)-binding domain-containing protein n=1 Tax=Favolaschia claudopus TaxID=2862362 RepID=A0AAW0BYX4_9AGAR
MSAQKSALILGSTGQVGGLLLKELLTTSTFTRVGEFGRRTTSLDALPAQGREKLQQKVIDFEKLDDAGLREGNWDVVFITIGTTVKVSGSAEAFERIDRKYVVDAARAAKSEGHSQRLVYVSSVMADSKSHFLYTRSKGLTEDGLASLGYDDTIVFRPAALAGTNRLEPRIGETIANAVASFGSLFSSSLRIKIGTLARSLLKAGDLGSAGLPAEAKATTVGKEGARFTLIGNSGALALARKA